MPSWNQLYLPALVSPLEECLFILRPRGPVLVDIHGHLLWRASRWQL